MALTRIHEGAQPITSDLKRREKKVCCSQYHGHDHGSSDLRAARAA